jgi:dTDP-4-dehydrorhamnose 3,5-epimerase
VSEVRPLAVPGAWLFVPDVHGDDRGAFAETYTEAVFVATVGHPLVVAQVNTSVSRRGTLRGLHYSVAPEGQAKYVTCPAGAVLDVVVDLRVGSPTFGAHDAVELDAASRSAVFVSEGLGHAFLALTDDAVVTYLCSTPYSPQHELAVSPLDPALGLPWPADLAPYVVSDRDAAAPSLAAAAAAGLLPALG